MLRLPEIEDIERAKAAAGQHKDAGVRLSVYCNFSNCGGIACPVCMFGSLAATDQFTKWEKTL